MKFDNKQFEQGIAQSQKSLENLNKSLQMKGATTGLSSIEAAANKVSFSPMQKGVDALSQRFSAMGIVGMTVIQNLTTSAMNAGAKIGSALINPLIQGGKNRALNLEAAQFQIEGLGQSWDVVKQDILYGVKDTAYGLDAAAKAAGQLLASNVEVGDSMKTALRGISGVAAMTNSEYEDIASVFTTVAGNGRLMSNELNRLSARGINAAATLGKYLNKSEAEIREMTSKGQIDFATFAKAMDDAFGAHAKEANKTFTGALSNMKAALSRIGADFATPMYENLRDIMNALTPLIDKIHDDLGPIIGLVNRWMGNLTANTVDFINSINDSSFALRRFFNALFAIGKGLNNIAENVMVPIFETIGQVFRESFDTENFLLNLSEATRAFRLATEELKPSEETLSQIKSIFQGLWSAIHIGFSILSAFIGLLKDVAIALAPVGGFLLELAAKLGDFITSVDRLVTEGETFSGIFGSMGQAIKDFMSDASPLGQFLSSVLTRGLDAVADLASKIAGALSTAFSTIAEGAGSFVKSLHLTDILNAINAVLFGGILIGAINFITKLKAAFSSGMGGLKVTWINPFTSALTQLKFSLQDMSNSVKVNSILKIAAAVGILAIAMKVLSEIDPVSLAGALGAITVGFTELLGIMMLMEKHMSFENVANIRKTAVTMIALGIAINIFASAVKKLASLDFQQLTIGLVGVGILLGELALFMNNAEFDKVGVLKGIGILMIAESLILLSTAVEKLAALNVKELVKGLGSVLVLLAGITAFTRFSGDGKGMISIGIGMLALAGSMIILSTAIEKLGKLSIKELAKGIGSMSAALLILAGVMRLMPKSILLIGPGLLVVATAINILASALQKLGSMSVESLVKSIGALVSALTIMAVAATVMKSAIGGAIAIQIFAGALAILAPVLMLLGSMSLEQIVTSLIALGGAFAVLGIAGAVIGPMIPAILGLSAAMGVLGVAMVAIGGGMLMFSIALATLAVSGAAGAAALVSAIESIATIIPTLVTIIGQTLIGVLETLAGSFDILLATAVTMITALLQAIIDVAPKIVEAVTVVVTSILSALTQAIPKFIELVTTTILEILASIRQLFPAIMETVATIIMSILTTLADNAEEFAATGVMIIVNFIKGIASKLPDVIDAAFKVIISFINGLADAIRANGPALGEAVMNLITAIIEGALGFILGAVGPFLEGGGELIQGFIEGVGGFVDAAITSITDMIQGCVDAIGGFVGDFATAAGNLVQGFISGIGEFASGAWDAVTSFGAGIVGALNGSLDEHSPSKISEKSGKFFVQGFINGMNKKSSEAYSSISDIANYSIKAMDQVNRKLSNAFNFDLEVKDPVITPVIDLTKANKGIDTLKSELQFADVADKFNASVSGNYSKANSARLGSTASIPDTSNQPVNLTQNFAFNQTNNSPKALSNIDIYRQTNNQFTRFAAAQHARVVPQSI